MSVIALIGRIRHFRDERDWMKFHDPKNLAVSVVIEAAELLEHFQWTDKAATERHIAERKEQIADEIADVAIYLLELADNIGIDFEQAVHTKLDKNAMKYPIEKSRGIATKYTDL